MANSQRTPDHQFRTVFEAQLASCLAAHVNQLRLEYAGEAREPSIVQGVPLSFCSGGNTHEKSDYVTCRVEFHLWCLAIGDGA